MTTYTIHDARDILDNMCWTLSDGPYENSHDLDMVKATKLRDNRDASELDFRKHIEHMLRHRNFHDDNIVVLAYEYLNR